MAKKKKTIRLTTAQAVVRFLSVQYSERDGSRQRLIRGVFGIYGHGNVCGLGQALEEYGKDLPYFQPCNEQGMVHIASGLAKRTQRMQTMACTSSIGPGATNMVTGAATATTNRLPVLLLPSDYFANRHQGPVLQQLEHPVSADTSVNDALRPVSRFFDRITRPEQLLTALPSAMRVLTDPADTGAVTICLPQDVQSYAYDFPVNFFEERVWRVERRIADPQRIDEAVALLKSARRPMVIAGGGVHYSDAGKELMNFCRNLGIPVSETFAGKGAVTQQISGFVGAQGVEGSGAAAKLSAKADLVIAVGTRLTDFSTGSQTAFQNAKVRFIGINVNSMDAHKNGSVPILGDARETLKRLGSAARKAGVKPNAKYLAEADKAWAAWERTLKREAFAPVKGSAMRQGEVINQVQKASRRGDTVVAAAGSIIGDVNKCFHAFDGRTAMLEFAFSCMGWEIPAAIGARMVQPKGEIYAMIGDGVYLMNPTELVTAVQENLKITVIVTDNHGFQVIRRLQMFRAGISFGNELRERDTKTDRLEGDYVDIDFAANARSFGLAAWQVATPEELADALAEARREKGPCLIVAEIEKHEFGPGGGVWWDALPAEVSGNAVTRKIRKGYEGDRDSLQRFYY